MAASAASVSNGQSAFADLANRLLTWLNDARQVQDWNNNSGINWTLPAAVTGTAVASNKITATAHGLSAGQKVFLAAPNTGVLPAPLTPATAYYLVSVTANDFSLAATRGGAVITITGSLNGNITVQPVPDYFDLDVLGNAVGLNCAPTDVASVTNAIANVITMLTGGTPSVSNYVVPLTKLSRPAG